jgi:hypothetical protein
MVDIIITQHRKGSTKEFNKGAFVWYQVNTKF